jgi:hypothetical protein
MATRNGEAQGPNLEELLRLGIQTAKEGNKASARMMFQQVLSADKQNERALVWMAAVAETPEDRVRYLRTVLRYHPNNQTALKQLDKMRRKRASSNSQVIRYGLMFLVVVSALVALAIVALFTL